jgi:four helix bundle protein
MARTATTRSSASPSIAMSPTAPLPAVLPDVPPPDTVATPAPAVEARAGKVTTYRDLIVWQRAMDLALACHQLGAALLAAGHDGPGDELQRTAILVPSRIATGHGRPDRPGFLELLGQASLALRTVETQLLLLQRLALVPAGQLTEAFTLADDTGRLLHGLRTSLSVPRVAT